MLSGKPRATLPSEQEKPRTKLFHPENSVKLQGCLPNNIRQRFYIFQESLPDNPKDFPLNLAL